MGYLFNKHLLGASALILTATLSSSAIAGGFSIREQSVSGQGASFAGNAAGYDLSTIFWNPAGVAIAGKGITTESHVSVILPDSEIDPDDVQTANPVLNLFPVGGNNIDKVAFVPSSYGSYRINDKWTVGYGFNAPFGLSTEADDKVWAGQFDFREAELLTYNFNPVVGYQITPTLALGVGLQVQYTDLELKQAAGTLPGFPTATFDGQDWGFGFTLGALWTPTEGTSIGVGFRSRVNSELEGDLTVQGVPAATQAITTDFDLPEIVTVSIRQSITEKMRVLGTFEWTNWSIFDTTSAVSDATGASLLTINTNWDDGYFLSGGLEYDYSSQLTLRTGIAYEWSPIQNPNQRLVSVPDTDRLWLSVGATYNYSETTSIDLAYTHIFLDEERINSAASGLTADADTSIDIIGVSLKMKWGADHPIGYIVDAVN